MYSLGYYQHLSKGEQIEWLKKQRSGAIIGEYRNRLCKVYRHIKDECDRLSHAYCIYEQSFSPIRFKGIYDPFECCVALHELGYISIQRTDSQHKISIIKDIDF